MDNVISKKVKAKVDEWAFNVIKKKYGQKKAKEVFTLLIFIEKEKKRFCLNLIPT